MHRIRVTHKGETGYLLTTVDLNLRTHHSVTLDPEAANAFATAAHAERFAAKVAHRFDDVEIEPATTAARAAE